MRKIAIVNQKGGVGKSVTTVNLAIGLARQGKKVVAIDLDAQGSLTVSLGFTEQDKLPVTIATLMERIIEDEDIEPLDGILHHEENIDLIPANIELSGTEVTLVNTMSRECILREYLKIIENDYEIAILDCSPSLGMVTINALACADEIIIPVQAQYLSIKGMEQLFKTINKIKKQINPNLMINGILITMADLRTNYTKDIISLLKETYSSKIRIFESIIPFSVRASEISAEGKSIFVHDPNGKVAEAYENMVLEVLE
ncbi:MAG: ParA family protein [Coprobacillaceae bacterium]